MDKDRRGLLRAAWRIAAPYWRSEQRWSAILLLALIVALSLGQVGLTVRLNYWRNAFFNTFQNVDETGFYHQLLIFAGLAAIWVAVGMSYAFLSQMLRIRWRQWLTDRYLDRWLRHRAYYRMQLEGSETDNPDQRIAEDVRDFIDNLLTLALGLLTSVVSLFSFIFILWSLSGPLTVALGPLGQVTIPAYLVWLVIGYAIFGTAVAMRVGRPLIGLNFMQQRYEADFRYSLVRLRENTESVAFYGGEARESDIFRRRFAHIVTNFWQIMFRQLKLNGFTFVFGQASVVFPYLVQAPRFFAKQIKLGDLMQTAEAFGQVLDALSFIINSYSEIAGWSSIVQRLARFDDRVETLAVGAADAGIDVEPAGHGVAVRDLALALPDGAALLPAVGFDVAPGEALLLTGPTGLGKSTLLRAIAGLWPFARGRVRLDPDRVFFVPQRAYVPLGSLRQALAYPRAGADIPDQRLRRVLHQVGLGGFDDQLDVVDNWAQRLSGGEQQRLAFARVLLAEPAVVFLDEATSAMDEATEARLYRLLRQAPWRPTLISVGHRSTLRAFHDRVLDLAPAAPAATAQA